VAGFRQALYADCIATSTSEKERTLSWISTLDYEGATGKLRTVYDRVRGPNGELDNILKAHSLRPHTLEGHMALYKSVLHHTSNRLPQVLLETLGVYVSLLNGCAYCTEHHFEGLRRLLRDDERASHIRQAFESGALERAFDARQLAILRYAKQLTQAPATLDPQSVQALRQAGLDDGGVLEINQVVSYFAYANRTVLGLGVTTEGEGTLGRSPAGESDNWEHV